MAPIIGLYSPNGFKIPGVEEKPADKVEPKSPPPVESQEEDQRQPEGFVIPRSKGPDGFIIPQTHQPEGITLWQSFFRRPGMTVDPLAKEIIGFLNFDLPPNVVEKIKPVDYVQFRLPNGKISPKIDITGNSYLQRVFSVHQLDRSFDGQYSDQTLVIDVVPGEESPFGESDISLKHGEKERYRDAIRYLVDMFSDPKNPDEPRSINNEQTLKERLAEHKRFTGQIWQVLKPMVQPKDHQFDDQTMQTALNILDMNMAYEPLYQQAEYLLNSVYGDFLKASNIDYLREIRTIIDENIHAGIQNIEEIFADKSAVEARDKKIAENNKKLLRLLGELTNSLISKELATKPEWERLQYLKDLDKKLGYAFDFINAAERAAANNYNASLDDSYRTKNINGDEVPFNYLSEIRALSGIIGFARQAVFNQIHLIQSNKPYLITSSIIHPHGVHLEDLQKGQPVRMPMAFTREQIAQIDRIYSEGTIEEKVVRYVNDNFQIDLKAISPHFEHTDPIRITAHQSVDDQPGYLDDFLAGTKTNDFIFLNDRSIQENIFRDEERDFFIIEFKVNPDSIKKPMTPKGSPDLRSIGFDINIKEKTMDGFKPLREIKGGLTVNQEVAVSNTDLSNYMKAYLEGDTRTMSSLFPENRKTPASSETTDRNHLDFNGLSVSIQDTHYSTYANRLIGHLLRTLNILKTNPKMQTAFLEAVVKGLEEMKLSDREQYQAILKEFNIRNTDQIEKEDIMRWAEQVVKTAAFVYRNPNDNTEFVLTQAQRLQSIGVLENIYFQGDIVDFKQAFPSLIDYGYYNQNTPFFISRATNVLTLPFKAVLGNHDYSGPYVQGKINRSLGGVIFTGIYGIIMEKMMEVSQTGESLLNTATDMKASLYSGISHLCPNDKTGQTMCLEHADQLNFPEGLKALEKEMTYDDTALPENKQHNIYHRLSQDAQKFNNFGADLRASYEDNDHQILNVYFDSGDESLLNRETYLKLQKLTEEALSGFSLDMIPPGRGLSNDAIQFIFTLAMFAFVNNKTVVARSHYPIVHGADGLEVVKDGKGMQGGYESIRVDAGLGIRIIMALLRHPEAGPVIARSHSGHVNTYCEIQNDIPGDHVRDETLVKLQKVMKTWIEKVLPAINNSKGGIEAILNNDFENPLNDFRDQLSELTTSELNRQEKVLIDLILSYLFDSNEYKDYIRTTEKYRTEVQTNIRDFLGIQGQCQTDPESSHALDQRKSLKLKPNSPGLDNINDQVVQNPQDGGTASTVPDVAGQGTSGQAAPSHSTMAIIDGGSHVEVHFEQEHRSDGRRVLSTGDHRLENKTATITEGKHFSPPLQRGFGYDIDQTGQLVQIREGGKAPFFNAEANLDAMYNDDLTLPGTRGGFINQGINDFNLRLGTFIGVNNNDDSDFIMGLVTGAEYTLGVKREDENGQLRLLAKLFRGAFLGVSWLPYLIPGEKTDYSLSNLEVYGGFQLAPGYLDGLSISGGILFNEGNAYPKFGLRAPLYYLGYGFINLWVAPQLDFEDVKEAGIGLEVNF